MFLLEMSILFGNSSRHKDFHFSIWVVLTAAHTFGVLLSLSIIKIYLQKSSKVELNYFELSGIGIAVATTASVAYNVLGRILHAPLARPQSIILTVLIFGIFWFPQAIILGNQRHRISASMLTYENRLIIESRKSIRESEDFYEIERRITSTIIQELNEKCQKIIGQIRSILDSVSDLQSRNSRLHSVLQGEELRAYSIQLEKRGSVTDKSSYVNRALYSTRLFARQYRLLYWQSTKFNPLPNLRYTLILMLVVLPSMLHYLTMKQILFSSLFLILGSLGLAQVIAYVIKVNGKRSLLYTSILTFAIGLLPYALQIIESRVIPENRSDYPVFIMGFMVPAGYYVLMKFLQLTQNSTHELIESGQLVVSSEVTAAVAEVIDYEFNQTLSHTWAIFVHGKILTRLAATSLRLEQATNKADESGFNQAVDILLQVLQTPESSFLREKRNLQDEVMIRLQPWEGLVEINLELDPKLQNLIGFRVSDVGEVLEEAISNSVRHGKSGIINIDLKLSDVDQVQITVKDNSQVEIDKENVRYGLGTKLFNLVSDGRWNLSHSESGTIFSSTINVKGVD